MLLPETSVAAQLFFRQQRFLVVDTFARYYDDGQDAYLLEYEVELPADVDAASTG